MIHVCVIIVFVIIARVKKEFARIKKVYCTRHVWVIKL